MIDEVGQSGNLGDSNGSLTDMVALKSQADVFLEKRDSRELERNGLVSIFLRGELLSALMAKWRMKPPPVVL